MLTVEDVMGEVLAGPVNVVAGADRLGADVTWAAALRSRAPGFDALKGGEIALVSLRTLAQLDDRLTLSRLIDQIAGFGVSAVAVSGQIDRDAVLSGNRHAIPLIQLNDDVSLRDLEQRIQRVIVDRRAELQRQGQDIYHQLLEVVVSGRGSEAVVGRLAEMTGHPAVLEDSSLNVLTIRIPERSHVRRSDVLAMLAQHRDDDLHRLAGLSENGADPPTIRLPLNGSGAMRMVAPVSGPSGREGYLSIIGSDTNLTSTDRLAVSRAAAACAIDLARERTASGDADRRLGEVIDDLVTGNYTTESALLARGQRYGLDLTASYIAVAIRATVDSGVPASRQVDRALRRELARRNLPQAIRTEPDDVLVLLPAVGGQDNAQSVITALRDATPGSHLAAAITMPAGGLGAIREAFSVARRALDLTIRTQGPDSILAIGSLGVDELLLALGPSTTLTAFRNTWLGKLVEYDEKNHTQLVQTLATYFEAHNSPTEAAESLHLHRNTLLYRLQRIRDITGRDPDDAANHLAYHLALRIAAVLPDH